MSAMLELAQDDPDTLSDLGDLRDAVGPGEVRRVSSGLPIEPLTPLNGPYRVVLERLRRLVHYRAQMLAHLTRVEHDPHAAAELVRIRHMIREVHRAVSLNPPAKLAAQQLDPGEPVAPPAPGFGA